MLGDLSAPYAVSRCFALRLNRQNVTIISADTTRSSKRFSMFVYMTKRIHWLTIVSIAQIWLATPLISQNEFGALLGAGLNFHSASFERLGSYPSCCPEFSGGSGTGIYLGAWYAVPLSERVRFIGRLTYSGEPGTMTDDERSFVADLRDTAKVVDALFRHELSASLASLGIEPMVAFRVAGRLDVMAGFRLALVVASGFRQTETLTEPEDFGTYLGASRVWVNTQADIPDASALRFTINGGLRYVLPLNAKSSTFLAPEITYSLPVTGVASGVDWNVAQLRVGIGFGWQFESTPDTIVPPVKRHIPSPPPIFVVDQPTATIVARGVYVDGRVVENPSILIEDTQVTTLHPLLGHIYFDEGSSEIPARYEAGQRRALEDTTGLDPLTATHGVLAIIALRMKRNPEASLRITGNTSGTPSDNGLALSRSRADRVRDELVKLGVEPMRMSVAARATPASPTKATEGESVLMAAEENRRVEIVASEPGITGPVSLGSTDVHIEPAFLRYTARAESPVAIDLTTMHIKHGDSILRQLGNSPRGEFTVDVDVQGIEAQLTAGHAITATITVTDSLGRTATATSEVPVRRLNAQEKRVERLGTTFVERYGLILFDFNDVGVRGENAKLLDLIRSRIDASTTVKVIGLTDLMGSTEYNRDLSLRRAQEVARLLGVPRVQIEGVGESNPLFPNALPEGRAYNRTVIVELVRSAP